MTLVVVSGLSVVLTVFLIGEVSAADGQQQQLLLAYDYTTTTTLNAKARGAGDDAKSRRLASSGGGAPLGVTLRARLEVTPLVWDDIGVSCFRIEAKNAHVNVSAQEFSPGVASDLNSVAFLFVSTSGEEKSAQFYTAEENGEAVNNFLRGVVSIFLYESDWLDDAGGRCRVNYSTDEGGTNKSKTKKCQSPGARQKKLLDVTTAHTYEAEYHFPQGVSPRGVTLPESVTARETFAAEVTLKEDAGYLVGVTQDLKLTEQHDDAKFDLPGFSSPKSIPEAVTRLELREGTKLLKRPLQPQPLHEEEKKVNVKNLVSSLRRNLQPGKLATVDATAAFLKLAEAFGGLTQKEVQVLLKDRKNRDIIPQVLDVLGYLCSADLHETVVDLYQSDLLRLERYLWALSQSKRTEVKVVRSLLELAKSKKIKATKARETIILTIAALANKLGEEQLVSEVVGWLVSSLESCQDSRESCQLAYLRAFRNLQNEASLDQLIRIMEQRGSQRGEIPLATLKALSMYQKKLLLSSRAVMPALTTVFQDLKQDSGVRGLAAELILRLRPSQEVFRDFLSVLKRSRTDFAFFCISRMIEFGQSDPHLDQMIRSHQASGHLDWYLLSPAGLSTSFARVLAATTSKSVANFSFGTEIAGSVFKRSSFQVILADPEETEQLIQLDVFASGLSSYLGSGNDNGSDDDSGDARAGMELRLFGVSLRPFVFFESAGDLMALYWSGKTAEKTSALQATQMMQDSNDWISMSNGFIFRASTKGSVSYDFSGQADISVWDKTCLSVVHSSGAYGLSLTVSMPLPPYQSGSKKKSGIDCLSLVHTVSAEAQLNLQTELDFGNSDQLDMCIRMEVPEFQVKFSTVKYVEKGKVNDQEEASSNLQFKSERTEKVSGKTLLLNQKNCELCNKMYPKTTRQ